MIGNHKVVALEEHYLDQDLVRALRAPAAPLFERLLTDFTGERLSGMDKAGIDLQVVSHFPPALQGLLSQEAVEMAVAVNNRLQHVVNMAPDRFAAFATLPTFDPEASAR